MPKKQHFSGGRPALQGISKRGDTNLRTLLIHGARSAVLAAQRKTRQEGWLQHLLQRRCHNFAAEALVNKNVRIAWALLAHDRTFLPDYMPAAVAT